MVHLAPSMAKQLEFSSDHSTEVPKRDYDRLNIDALLESLFAVSDSGLIDASFDGLVESRSTDSLQDELIQRAIHFGSEILEAGKRSASKRSSDHNASVWPLSPDLTIKVFSMLDTPSVWSAASTCLFFQKCAKDPLCYTNIDLAALVPKIRPKIIVPKINARVSTMIEHAGNALQSIKLCAPYYDEAATLEEMLPIFTCSCLSSLTANGGAPGDVHISRILESVSRYCCLLERFEYVGGSSDLLEASVCKEFVFNCPKITTLALQGCKVFPSEAFELVKVYIHLFLGFHELKYVDFSCCHPLTGAFLENLATNGGADNLEVLILRGLYSNLEKVDVKKFMNALLAGKFRHPRHLDISENTCLYIVDDYDEFLQYDIRPMAIKKALSFPIYFRSLMHSAPSTFIPSMAKQLCFSDHSTEVPKRNYDQLNIDSLLESVFAVSNSGLIDASFDGLVKSRSSDSHQDDFIQRALHLGSVILEAGKRSARKRSSVHNASVWPLSPDLTIKVFSMLDTPSVWSAAATCLFFQKCAKDPLCYTNIDLAALVPKMRPKIIVPKINARVSTIIERAGNALQ
ncbi:hypothetical protein LXL04_018818 [Taraxacum kok-saghyz]